MKNKQGNVVIIALIIAIVAITAGAIGFLFARKTEAPAQTTYTQSQVPAAVTQQLSVQTQPTEQTMQAADETANWQTYTNKRYDFSFKYPKNLKFYFLDYTDPSTRKMASDWFVENPIKEKEGGLFFNSCLTSYVDNENKNNYDYYCNNDYNFDLLQLSINKTYSNNLDNWMNNVATSLGSDNNSPFEDVTVGGFSGKAYYSKDANGDFYDVGVERNGNVYTFQVGNMKGTSRLEDFKKILSTFKFTN